MLWEAKEESFKKRSKCFFQGIDPSPDWSLGFLWMHNFREELSVICCLQGASLWEGSMNGSHCDWASQWNNMSQSHLVSGASAQPRTSYCLETVCPQKKGLASLLNLKTSCGYPFWINYFDKNFKRPKKVCIFWRIITKRKSIISPRGFRKIRLHQMLNILHTSFIACHSMS